MQLRTKLIADYYLGGLLHVVLKPAAIVLGKVLHRPHSLSPCAEITVVKMLGGGSLAIAYPAFLALKRLPGLRRLRIVTTPAIEPFARSLNIFDEVLVIRDGNPFSILADSLRALRRLFLTDAIVDLEIYSRLTTVFALLTCAKNRVGFYTDRSFWRRRISSHLLFCNFSNGIYNSYDQIAVLFGATLPGEEDCRASFRASASLAARPAGGTCVIAVAPCCSDLSPERMLHDDEWAVIVRSRVAALAGSAKAEVHLLGAPADRARLEALKAALAKGSPGVPVSSHAGEFTLEQSIRFLGSARVLLCIDSSLLHFARLVGVPTVSFWGPTDPRTLLRPWPGSGDEVHYRKISCSPCVHLAQQPPCGGNNLCMRLAADPERNEDPNPAWVIAERRGGRFSRFSAP
ncbi:MAG TPA: glycosyltransferase family 9 protein [Opitutaceae bacterium]